MQKKIAFLLFLFLLVPNVLGATVSFRSPILDGHWHIENGQIDDVTLTVEPTELQVGEEALVTVTMYPKTNIGILQAIKNKNPKCDDIGTGLYSLNLNQMRLTNDLQHHVIKKSTDFVIQDTRTQAVIAKDIKGDSAGSYFLSRIYTTEATFQKSFKVKCETPGDDSLFFDAKITRTNEYVCDIYSTMALVENKQIALGTKLDKMQGAWPEIKIKCNARKMTEIPPYDSNRNYRNPTISDTTGRAYANTSSNWFNPMSIVAIISIFAVLLLVWRTHKQ